jgi:hypothetical protein
MTMSLGERPLKLISEYSKPMTHPQWKLMRPHVNPKELYECYKWVLNTPVRIPYPIMFDYYAPLQGFWNKHNTIVWNVQICRTCDEELVYKSMNEYINYNGYCNECHEYICYR